MNAETEAKFREGWERRDGRLFIAGVELPEGPWHLEADEKVFEHAGVRCLMLRTANGNWCGYACIPVGHPWHGRGRDWFGLTADVHGGVAFSGLGNFVRHDDPAVVIGPQEPLWWIGFDTIHAYDLMLFLLVAPKLIPGFPTPRGMLGRYWSEPATERETRRLAEQVAAAAAASN